MAAQVGHEEERLFSLCCSWGKRLPQTLAFRQGPVVFSSVPAIVLFFPRVTEPHEWNTARVGVHGSIFGARWQHRGIGEPKSLIQFQNLATLEQWQYGLEVCNQRFDDILSSSCSARPVFLPPQI